MQVLIYAGAIAILIIFAIMLTREVQQGNLPNRLQPVAVLFPALLLAALVFVAVDTDWNLLEDRPELQHDVEVVQSNTIGGVSGRIEDLKDQIADAETRAEEQLRDGLAEAARQSKQEAEAAAKEIAHLEVVGARSGIGDLLINDFVLPFEAASVLLLAAVIGALVLVRER